MHQMVSCSHYRAVHFFTESIKNEYAFQSFPYETYDAFKSGRCHVKRITYMGYFSNKQPRIYYFMTGESAPFTGTNVPMKCFHFIVFLIKNPESLYTKKIKICSLAELKIYSYNDSVKSFYFPHLILCLFTLFTLYHIYDLVELGKINLDIISPTV